MIELKKIITAIGNPKINEELKKEINFEIIGKDIQYREAIIEILEKNNKINFIILHEKIPGEINFDKLIKKIKIINKKIKIIFIIEKENKILEKILKKNKIKSIYYSEKINKKELIKIIEKENTKKNKNINSEENIIMFPKIITFSGNSKSGKTTLALIASYYLAQENKKVLLVDADFEKQDLSFLFKKEKKRKQKTNKEKIFLKHNKIKYLKKQKNNFIKLKNKLKIEKIFNKNKNYKINYKKINNNLYFNNKFNFYLKDKLLKKENNIKKIIYNFFKKENLNFDFIIIDISKNNFNVNNKTLLEKSNINFLVIEPNLLGVKEIERTIKKYTKEWNIDNNNLYIISNKKTRVSINKNLIYKILKLKNKINEIEENKIYIFLIYSKFKRKIFLKNKKIKRDIYKILKIIKTNNKKYLKDRK